ncbi:hypothetical protein SLEP1_g7564 [Rubroshorea leprosula]|uniref:Photosystem II 5 kDa protein, chloroplastic n=1 Tax=Rubroshorea leprosula TaxID=152421 RepID=A0AAV5I816_9ROSI|nr:hypothetical protein SLEP1_g7564 [Rubroshorea leprosula]
MASITMTASLLPNSSSTLTNVEMREESNGRRELIFAAAAAAAAAFSIAKLAMAGEEPKAGTAETKKKYAPICVTMPTARVCHK